MRYEEPRCGIGDCFRRQGFKSDDQGDISACIHISSGQDTCAAEGSVAFGSNAIEFFEYEGKCKFAKGCKVFIAASGPEFGCEHLYKAAHAVFEANFVKWKRADERGRHPCWNLRPSSTRDDTAFIGFWEVSGLQPLLKPIPFSNFSVEETGVPLKLFTLRGPLKVTLVDK